MLQVYAKNGLLMELYECKGTIESYQLQNALRLTIGFSKYIIIVSLRKYTSEWISRYEEFLLVCVIYQKPTSSISADI